MLLGLAFTLFRALCFFAPPAVAVSPHRGVIIRPYLNHSTTIRRDSGALHTTA
jgi:hypothetical protein